MTATLRVIAAVVRTAAAPAALTALLVLAMLFLEHHFCSQANSFDSDTLFAVEVGQDLLGRGYEFAGWHLPGAPYLFPDTLLTLLSLALCKNLAVAFLLYNLLLYAVMLAALTGLFRLAGLRARAAYLLACSGLLCLLVAHLDAAYGLRSFLLTYPSNHTGVIAVGLVLCLLVVKNLH